MKKKIKCLAALLAALTLLSACSGENDRQSSDTAHNGGNETAAAAGTHENAIKTENNDTVEGSSVPVDDPTLITDKSQYPTNLCGLAADKISADSITQVHKDDYDSDWTSASCNGFVYLSEPTGINYNSIDNADIFNDMDNSFDESPTESLAEYKKYSVGDEICGLVIDEATTMFKNASTEKTFDERFFSGCVVKFKGEKKLSGYLIILSEELYGVGGVGDIVFIPDGGSQTLPVMNFYEFSEEGKPLSNLLKYSQTVGGLCFKNEYGFISCGSLDDYDSSWFLGKEHNLPLKATITVDNIYMSAVMNWITNCSGVIASIEF